jgi:hypothetical protein
MSTADAPEALPQTDAAPAPMPPPPEGSGQGAPPPIAEPQPGPPPVTDGVQAQKPGASAAGDVAAPGDNLAAGRAAAEEQASAAQERSSAEQEQARAAQEAEKSAAEAPRARIGATRSLRPPAAAADPSPPPPPPPMPPAAVAPEAAQPPPTAAITAPPAATSNAPVPYIAEAKPSDFQMAELKFNKPEQMEIDTPYTVSATIAGALAETQATLGNVGPTVTRQVKITRKARVELVADDFDIKKLHAMDTVLITPETSGEWHWQVTPRRVGGDRKILLQVYGVIERDGVSQGETLIKTYEETIPVKVTPMARVRLVSQGIVDRWQPIAGALGVIGGIWVFLQKVLAALMRRRKEEHA